MMGQSQGFSKKNPQLGTLNGSRASQRPSQVVTSRATGHALVVGIRFLLCESQTPDEKRILEDAYQYCIKRKFTDATWIQASELASLSLDNLTSECFVYIVHPFSGPGFEMLKENRCRVYSAQCLEACLKKDCALPKHRGYPIASRALHNAEVCCSALDGPTREMVFAKVHEMGGLAKRVLHPTATHLITTTTGSLKYHAAVKINMKIVLPKWLDAIMKRQDSGEDYSYDYEIARRFRVPIFSGFVMCISQFFGEHRKLIENKITSNGGEFDSALVREKTMILICDEAAGPKYEAAKKWKLPVVKSDWLNESIKKGYCEDYNSYLLPEARPKEPVLSQPPIPDHVRQGPNGLRATSTPHKHAKKLDHSLDISAVDKDPPVPLLEDFQLQQIRNEKLGLVPKPVVGGIVGGMGETFQRIPNNSLMVGENFQLKIWEPDHARHPVPENEVLHASSAPARALEGVPEEDEQDPQLLANGEGNGQGKRSHGTLGARILAMKAGAIPVKEVPAAPSASVPVDGPSSSVNPVPRVMLPHSGKDTTQELRMRAVLCWSQNERNPYRAAMKEVEIAEDVEVEAEVKREMARARKTAQVAPPAGRINAVTGGKIPEKPKPTDKAKEKSVEIPVARPKLAVKLAAEKVLPVPAPVEPVKKMGVKRTASIVVLDDDDAPEVPLAPPAPKKVDPPVVVEKVFQLSSITSDVDKKRIFASVKALGGREIDSTNFFPECTHLVVRLPIRNEKYLACCAAGKWILHPKYIEDSVAAGHFLPESMYEWGNYEHAATIMDSLNLHENDIKLAKTACRWRRKVAETGKRAFVGWKVVLAADAARSDGYARLLLAGGGELLTSTAPYLPFKDRATHLIHELSKTNLSEKDVAEFAAAGVNCQRAEYLSHFLTDESPSEAPVASGSARSTKKARR